MIDTTKKDKNYVLGKFNGVGINTVDIELVSKEWNHLWCLAQYGSEFKLVRYRRKNSDAVVLKTQISDTQAGELIEKLGLGAIKDSFFRKAIIWTDEKYDRQN